MNEPHQPDQNPPHDPSRDPAPRPPSARLSRPRFSLVWLIPVIAALIAGYLGYRTLVERGPLMVITFNTAEGLAAGQTQVKYKAVALGTVEAIDLSHDNSHVVAKVRMSDVGARFLTSHSRFWVVRPRLSLGDLSGLDTLVSGAFIAVDPGKPGGHYQDHFTGLEQPPGVRSDEPGRTYTLTADRIGSLTTGSPIYYRDVQVGEVLSYDIGSGLGPVKIHIFVKAPFDNLIRPASRFWNSSGIAAAIQGGVLRVELQSIQAVLTGAITFTLPKDADKTAPSPDNASFPLFSSYGEAKAATFQTQLPVVSYLTSSVAGLTPGAPVEILGIQVGDVTGVTLEVMPKTGEVEARVAMRLQPERVFDPDAIGQLGDPQKDFQTLVNHGLRVEIGTESYITGQKLVSLTMEPHAKPAKVTREGDAVVLPSAPGGLNAVLDSLSDVAAKVQKMPFQQIGDNLNKLLETANGTLGGPQLKHTLSQLSETLKSANTTLKTVNSTYGNDSEFEQSLQQVLSQADGTLRSIQSLADFLNRHPQSLLLGR
jgi:paraquat-inducible protein B